MADDIEKTLAHRTRLDPKVVSTVLRAFEALAKETLSSTNRFVWPGMVTLAATRTPARSERKGINPFTKEVHVFPARPEGTKLKATAALALAKAISKSARPASVADSEGYEDAPDEDEDESEDE